MGAALGIGADDLYWLTDDLGAMVMIRWTDEPWLGATKVHMALRHCINWFSLVPISFTRATILKTTLN